MTPEEQIAKMTKAINQAIKVMSDTFASSPGDFERAVKALKESMQKEAPAPAPKPAAPAESKPA